LGTFTTGFGTSTFGTCTTGLGTSTLGTFTVTFGLGTFTVTLGLGTLTVTLGLGMFGRGTVTVGMTGLMTGFGMSMACAGGKIPWRMIKAAGNPAINRVEIATTLSTDKINKSTSILYNTRSG
jgi:hypothetical protein